MKDEGLKVLKLIKTNSALDFLKNYSDRVLTTTEKTAQRRMLVVTELVASRTQCERFCRVVETMQFFLNVPQNSVAKTFVITTKWLEPASLV